MNLPNTITVGRIFLVPLLVVVLLTKFDGREWFGIDNEALGAAIFAIASATDWLDGYLARRRGQVTGLGQWMDPLADKLLVTAALVSLVSLGLASAWMVAVILGREFFVTVLRSLAHARGMALPASPMGKLKLVSQVVAILALLFAREQGRELWLIGQGALWIATITAIVSAVDYSRHVNLALGMRPLPESAPSPAPGPRPVLAPTEAKPAEKRITA